ncbi:29600_t:CDS:2 [Gigaspora margarita]|uniref:29600_t:CDS:1 n=1 Tax=Gigaspora margarita TaxID=4874 RepID=A0ABN7WC10_GIGMA|nr:29600_t:CDS:2 [Gigaspora margarita]
MAINTRHNFIFSEPIVLIPHITLQQGFKCEICETIYKTKRGLTYYQRIVQKYNVHRKELYTLPSQAIKQFKADLVHIIGSKLKEHYSWSGKQTITFPCLESLFFGVFKGHIHNHAYSQLASLFKNQNWERKFFSNDQHTFILLFNTQAQKANYKKKSGLPRLMVEWKTKSKRDAKEDPELEAIRQTRIRELQAAAVRT